MSERELAALIRDWAAAEATDGPSVALRPRIVAIPDTTPHRRLGTSAPFADRRTVLILAAVLALTMAVAGALAIGSGLVPVPWQDSTRIHPGAIDPCSVVAGGPARQVPELGSPYMWLGGSGPDDHLVQLEDYEEQRNRRPPRINSFEGRGCLYLTGDGPFPPLALFQLREHVTSADDAAAVVASLFRTGSPPFSAGPMRTVVQGHPAWVGLVAVPGGLGDDPYRVGLAVSADPYFFVVVPEVDTGLQLSDGAGHAWWEGHMEPQARALATELLERLGR
jgi:hypothetical protein